MSKLNPDAKVKDITEKILELCEGVQLTVAELTDVPAELERSVNRIVGQLKDSTTFKRLS